jgi:polar amino acid transport system substrate-binding protein
MSRFTSIGRCLSAMLTTALVLTACGIVGETDSGESTTARGGLEDGALDVLADGQYAPYAYLDTDGKTMLGMETQLLDAIAEKLGVEVRYTNMPFDSMIPAIANGRADLMIMGMADTEERRKQVDFVDLYRTTMRVITRVGNPSGFDLGPDQGTLDLTGLCGLSAAATTSGQQEQTIREISSDCEASGHEGIELLGFTQYSQEILAVKNGRVDFNLMVPPVAEYFLRTNPDFEALPGSFPRPGSAFTGWIVRKDNSVLQDPLLGAMDELVADGTWTDVLSDWGLTEADLVIPPTRNLEVRAAG